MALDRCFGYSDILCDLYGALLRLSRLEAFKAFDREVR
jgi:hypothetical protein